MPAIVRPTRSLSVCNVQALAGDAYGNLTLILSSTTVNLRQIGTWKVRDAITYGRAFLETLVQCVHGHFEHVMWNLTQMVYQLGA